MYMRTNPFEEMQLAELNGKMKRHISEYMRNESTFAQQYQVGAERQTKAMNEAQTQFVALGRAFEECVEFLAQNLPIGLKKDPSNIEITLDSPLELESPAVLQLTLSPWRDKLQRSSCFHDGQTEHDIELALDDARHEYVFAMRECKDFLGKAFQSSKVSDWID